MPNLWRVLLPLLFLVPSSSAQETHSHEAPEKLGRVSFPISCMPAVQDPFDRGVALLHSFAYTAAEEAFQGVAELDPRCAMAHWGVAMTYFHQLWDPPIEPATTSTAQKEVQRAQQIGDGIRYQFEALRLNGTNRAVRIFERNRIVDTGYHHHLL